MKPTTKPKEKSVISETRDSNSVSNASDRTRLIVVHPIHGILPRNGILNLLVRHRETARKKNRSQDNYDDPHVPLPFGCSPRSFFTLASAIILPWALRSSGVLLAHRRRAIARPTSFHGISSGAASTFLRTAARSALSIASC